jgi:ABC-type antimicrobial peptide transport system permease subunit
MRFYPALFIRIFSRSSDVYILKIFMLAIAFSVSIVVTLFSINEFGYDTSHGNGDDVFRLLSYNTDKNWSDNRYSASIPHPALKSIGEQLAGTGTLSRIKALKKVTVMPEGNQPTYDQKIHAADSTIDKIFAFDIIEGSIVNFTRSKTTVAIVSKSTASHYFGDKPAIGKIIRLTTFGDTITVTVAAVFNDFPVNTHEDFNIFINYDASSLAALKFVPGQSAVYARLRSETIAPVSFKGISDNLEYVLQPVEDIYFGPRVLSEEARHGDVYSIVVLVCVASLILLLAICSFVNLSTITLPNRSKEIAVKKLNGKTPFQLLTQFVSESFGLTIASLLLALVILFAASRYLTRMLSVDFVHLMMDSKFIFSAAIVVMICAVIIAPVFMVIRFIRASPKRLLSSDAITFPRFKAIIAVVQFGVSIFLIVSSVLISRQINYSLIKEPGRNHDQIVYMACPPHIPDSAIHKIKAGWPSINPNVIDAVAVSQLPNRLQGKEVDSDLFVLEVDYNFKAFFQFEMRKGDWFEYTDRDSVIVVNDAALLEMPGDDRHVIGVIQDINSPFNQPEQPVKVRHARETTHNWICFRVEEVDVRNTVKWIESRMHAKGSRGEAHYYDEHFVAWLAYQDRLNALSHTLIVISLLMAGCSIYGLIVSLVRDEMKMIAVHHLFGAGLTDIASLLARGLVWQLLLAILFFGPLTYIFLTELLRTFVHATKFSWLDAVYPVCFALSAIIVLCTYQAFRLNRSDFASTLKGVR